MKAGKLLLLIAAFIPFVSCKEPFEPEVKNGTGSYLVVEGMISTSGPTTIRLSQTAGISEGNDVRGLAGAVVVVEGENNTTFSLMDHRNGSYMAPRLNLIAGQRYRLRIKTPGGKEYVSDYSTARVTPDIDSIHWKREDKGVNIYVNTHDPANSTRYYMWDYEETWETHSYAYSSVKTPTGGNAVARPVAEADAMFRCWRFANSTNILISSTAKLTRDVVSDFPLVHIPNAAERLAHRYSILVRQYALTREGFEYLQRMKKNSEQMGSVFDPQPSEATGNLRCISNPEEPVIGYVIISPVYEKRIFIERAEVPGWTFAAMCADGYVVNHPDSLAMIFEGEGHLPIDALQEGFRTIGYFYSTKACMDCRVTGSSMKPDFW